MSDGASADKDRAAAYKHRQPWMIGLITCTPGLCGGDPCLAGTRLHAASVARVALSGEDARTYFSGGIIEAEDVAACVAWWQGQVANMAYDVTEAIEESLRQLGRAQNGAEALEAVRRIESVAGRAVSRMEGGGE